MTLIRRRMLPSLLCFLLLLSTSAVLAAQTATGQTAESGKFRLYKFEQAIGEETYTITPEDGKLTLKSNFEFTDRSNKVPLETTFTGSSDYAPESFSTKGKSSRMSDIDDEVTIKNGQASIRQEKQIRTASVPATYFTIAGYSPVAMQMAMMRYWRGHGSPARLMTVPVGEVEIRDRGPEKVDINGKPVQLERYNVHGLIWGLETLWMDNNNNLAALVSTDAEFDHFEAMRDDYESALPKFVASAAHDQMEALAELGKNLPGRRSGVFAFTGATLIDGTGKPPIPNATIVTRDGKIAAAGPADKVKIPADAQRIDVSGKYIIPGLWDMHAHYEQVEWGPIYLAAGVTTVRDVGNEFEFIKAVRDALNSGQALGPHMLNAGIVDGSSKFAVGITRVDSPADAQKWVDIYHNAGFEQMKIYSSMTSDNVKAVCTDAHKVGMTVTGHIPEGMNAYDGVNDGMDQINHLHYVYDLLFPNDSDYKKAKWPERFKMMAAVDVNGPEGEKAVAFLKAHNTVIDPTMALTEMRFRAADQPLSSMEPGIDKVAPVLREQLVNGGLPPELATIGKEIRAKNLQLIGALHHAGVRIVAGTDQAVPGYSVYHEIELYNEAGFTPMEALQAATLVPAQVMKMDGVSGTVEKGKRADFDILDANPLQDIHNVRTIHRVVANGVLYESAPLWESVGFQP